MELFRYCHEEPSSDRESTVFIWCHAGVSGRVNVEHLPFWLDEVLLVYGGHVYIDLSWIVWENYIRHSEQIWLLRIFPLLGTKVGNLNLTGL